MYNWITLMFIWKMVNQLYFNFFNKKKNNNKTEILVSTFYLWIFFLASSRRLSVICFLARSRRDILPRPVVNVWFYKQLNNHLLVCFSDGERTVQLPYRLKWICHTRLHSEFSPAALVTVLSKNSCHWPVVVSISPLSNGNSRCSREPD